MKISALFTLMFTAFTMSAALPKPAADGTADAWTLLADLKTDPSGIQHLGDDGVLRAFDGNKKVIDYVAFSPTQIKQFINQGPTDDEQKAHLADVYDGVDGRTVTGEQLTNPGPLFSPKIFSLSEEELREVQAQGLSPVGAVSDTKLKEREIFQLEKRACYQYSCGSSAQCVSQYACTGCVTLDATVAGKCYL